MSDFIELVNISKLPKENRTIMIYRKGRKDGVNRDSIFMPFGEQKHEGLKGSLSAQNKKKTFIICNLMGKTFLPNPSNYKMVIHLDGDKTNNHISNLKWVHNSEAHKLAIDLGLKPILWGEENPTFIAVDQYTADGSKFIRRWGCITDVERELGIHHNNISKVCRGKRITAGGYHWKYTIFLPPD